MISIVNTKALKVLFRNSAVEFFGIIYVECPWIIIQLKFIFGYQVALEHFGSIAKVTGEKGFYGALDGLVHAG